MLPVNAIKLLCRMAALKINRINSDPAIDYDAAAATYDNYYSRYLGQSSQKLFDMMPLANGMKILDLACGTGFYSHRIAAKIGKEGQVSAVDASPGMLARNRESALAAGLTNIRFVEEDAIKFLASVDNDSVDGIVCGWGVCYMDHAQFRRQVERVVRPGGFLGIIENRANTLKAVSDLFREVMTQRPEALIKNMAINLPQDHQYLVKTFCKEAFQSVSAWDGGLSVPCNDGTEIWEYMVKSGASAGFLNAIDKGMFDDVAQRFIDAADARFKKHGGIDVKHEYCALLATKTTRSGAKLAKHIQ